MATTVDELEAAIARAVARGFKGRLLDRGEARAMIWRDGVLPEGAPDFVPRLTYDLHSYAYSLLDMGLRLRSADGNSDICRRAFEHAAMALESAIVRGSPEDDARSFHFVVAGAAFHLARFSARAYSILIHGQRGESFSPVERSLCHLILRNFNALEKEVLEFRTSGVGRDEELVAEMERKLDAIGPDDGFRKAMAVRWHPTHLALPLSTPSWLRWLFFLRRWNAANESS